MRLIKHLITSAGNDTPKKNCRFILSCLVVLLSCTAHAQVVGTPDTSDYDIVFKKVEKEPQFRGGITAWQQYLYRNLDALAPVKDNAKPGSYNVRVQFMVSEKGIISDVVALNGPADCPSCVASAIKVIEKSPRWQPAKQSGKSVNYRAVQVLTFLKE